MQVLFLKSHSTSFGRKRPSSGVFKTSTAAIGTCVIAAGKSPHLLIRPGTTVPALKRRCGDLPAAITHVPVTAVLVLNTPDDGRLRPKHVEWLCRNKTCTVLHQVGVSFDLYYDARKHKIKIKWHNFFPDLITSRIFSWTRLCFRPSCSHARVVSDASKSFGWRKRTFCINYRVLSSFSLWDIFKTDRNVLVTP